MIVIKLFVNSYKKLLLLTKSYVFSILDFAALFGFSEGTKPSAVALLSPYYSRSLSDKEVRLYSPRTGDTSGVFLDLNAWIAKGIGSQIASVDDVSSQVALVPVIVIFDDGECEDVSNGQDVISETLMTRIVTPHGKRPAPLDCDAPRKKRRDQIDFEA